MRFNVIGGSLTGHSVKTRNLFINLELKERKTSSMDHAYLPRYYKASYTVLEIKVPTQPKERV